MIYHITDSATWKSAKDKKYFSTGSLDTEGFIHCSPEEKILEVANNFYKGRKGLILLTIDESKVQSKIIREDLYGHGYEFPHIYGKLNLDAVIEVNDLVCDEDGNFILPKKD